MQKQLEEKNVKEREQKDNENTPPRKRRKRKRATQQINSMYARIKTKTRQPVQRIDYQCEQRNKKPKAEQNDGNQQAEDRNEKAKNPTVVDIEMIETPNTNQRDKFVIPKGIGNTVFHILSKEDQEMMHTIFMLDKM